MRKGCVVFLSVFLLLVLWVSSQLMVVTAMPRGSLLAVSLHVVSSSDDSYTVTGSPTISAGFIDQVLSAYGSPAAGTGHQLSDLGVEYGIDPVYALAFFLHEDRFGKTGWGAVNHSLGNSRCYGWSVCQGGYRYYATWADGYQDWYNLILNGYVKGQVSVPIVGHVCTTIAQIVPVYAPSGDHNDVAAYIQSVEHAVDTWRAGRIWV